MLLYFILFEKIIISPVSYASEPLGELPAKYGQNV